MVMRFSFFDFIELFLIPVFLLFHSVFQIEKQRKKWLEECAVKS